MASYKTKKNLLGSSDIYNRYYGDFRGVDLSSDHTRVNDSRLAYAVNMYKDYRSGQGQALETVAGYRRRFTVPDGSEIYAIHEFLQRAEDGSILRKILIHAGDRLYHWYNYPHSVGVAFSSILTLPPYLSLDAQTGLKTFCVTVDESVLSVTGVKDRGGEDIQTFELDSEAHILTLYGSTFSEGDQLQMTYIEGSITVDDAIFVGMNERKSVSFTMNNRLYIIDGKNYLVFDGDNISSVLDRAYVPATYVYIVPEGENADTGKEFEQRNILTPSFKHSFVADGTATEFYMNENELEKVSSVELYGEILEEGTDYTADLTAGKITFIQAPRKPEEVVWISGENGEEDVMYPVEYAGVVITAEKTIKSVTGVAEMIDEAGALITGCTVAAIFDNRVFLSGNPICPNHIFFCGENSTGYIDPTYFGVLNFVQDGVGSSPVSGLIPVADTLMALKEDTRHDGSVYFHTPYQTGQHVIPVTYPSTQGLSGTGCLGACANFLDDPVFISRFGVEAVGQLSVRYERAIEHRSSLIDAKLVGLRLRDAVLEEWNGYLMVLVDGKIFMADSRQRYTHDIGTVQYEWYYLENIGIWEGQYPEYKYSVSSELAEGDGNLNIHYCTTCGKAEKYCTCYEDGKEPNMIEVQLELASDVYNKDTGITESLLGQIANPADGEGRQTVRVWDAPIRFTVSQADGAGEYKDVEAESGVYFTVLEDIDPLSGVSKGYRAFVCEGKGAYTGGKFMPARTLKSMDENLFFGTENGIVCSFNFDKRNEDGEIPTQYYTFDGRTILCGCATKMDCCGVPHLTKNTVKKSTVIKTKSQHTSAAKVKVRTNRKPYSQIARINSTLFSFEDMDFSDFSFATTEQSLFAIKDKEKKWVEKQYYIYSDEYQRPFALFYIAFRYKIAGRYKE